MEEDWNGGLELYYSPDSKGWGEKGGMGGAVKVTRGSEQAVCPQLSTNK